MHVRYPLSDSKRTRILAKSERAMHRRMGIPKRKGPEVETASRWWAVWMFALGISQAENHQS